jgi:hypothetical protein
MLRTAVVSASIALIPTFAIALTPPLPHPGPVVVAPATQAIDSCYKKCFLDAKGLSSGRKFACRRACNASPRKKCEDNCWLKLGNDPKTRKKCLSRCS